MLNEYTVGSFTSIGDNGMPPPYIEIPSVLDILAEYPLDITHHYSDRESVYRIEFRIEEYKWEERARDYAVSDPVKRRSMMIDHGIRRCFLGYEAMKREQAFYESIRH